MLLTLPSSSIIHSMEYWKCNYSYTEPALPLLPCSLCFLLCSLTHPLISRLLCHLMTEETWHFTMLFETHGICFSTAHNSSSNKGDLSFIVLTLQSAFLYLTDTALLLHLPLCWLTLWRQIWHKNYKNILLMFFLNFAQLDMSGATVFFPAGKSKAEADYLNSRVWSPCAQI